MVSLFEHILMGFKVLQSQGLGVIIISSYFLCNKATQGYQDVFTGLRSVKCRTGHNRGDLQ